jgi:hypothetical protein
LAFRDFLGCFLGPIAFLVGRWGVQSVLGRAARLRAKGQRAQALHLLESVAQIEPVDYEDPDRVLARLERFDTLVQGSSDLYLSSLTVFLGAEGRPSLAVALLERKAGLTAEDYLSPARLSARLNEYCRKLPPATALLVFVRLSNALSTVGRFEDELAVLETLPPLQEGDYASPEQLAARLERFAVEALPLAVAAYLHSLAFALAKAARRKESLTAIAAALGAGAGDFEDPQRLAAAFRAGLDRVAKLQPLVAVGLLILLPSALEIIDRMGLALHLLERDAELRPEHYQDRRRLAARLHSRLKGLPPEVQALYLRSLMAALLARERAQDALAVLEADAGLEPADYDAPGRLAAKLRARCRDLPLDIAGVYLATVAPVFSHAGRSPAAAVVLEIDAGIDPADWSDLAALAVRLEERLLGMGADTAAGYVDGLARSLNAAGERRKAALVVDAYVRGVLRNGPSSREPTMAVVICPVYELWLRFWGLDPDRQPLEVCRALIPYLRQVVAERGTGLRDREEFIKSLSTLRQRILQTGLGWVRQLEPGPEERDLQRTVQLWDFELSQRLLVERFLLTPRLEVGPAEAPPPGRWPLSAAERPSSPSYLPAAADLAGANGLLSEIAGEIRPEADPSALTATALPPAIAALASRMRDEIGEERIAGVLGEHGLLVRATFTADGELVWTGLTGAGGRLAVVASGAGRPGDSSRLQWAAAWHDLELGYRYWWNGLSTAPMARRAWQKLLLDAARSLLEAVEKAAVLSPTAASNTLYEVTLGLLDHGFAQMEENERLPRAAGAGALRLLIALVWPVLDPPESELFPAWIRETAAELQAAESFLARGGRWPGRPRDLLDGATASYVQRIAGIWDLTPLAGLLGAETDVVVQVDDVLHAVPVAFVPVAGEPLHLRARSVRSSLSPLLDSLLGELTGESVRSRRLLSISCFQTADPARQGACWLHHGHLRLADEFRYEAVAGADRSGGTLGTLRAALERYGGFTVASVCGHGDYERTGIVLSGEDGRQSLWQGDGCDLSSVDWLLLVSCSIGRAKRSGSLDVEGFCARLAAHRARSLLACRWPVLAVEAAAFANETVKHYLELLDDPSAPAAAPLRAIALARARRSIASGAKPLVGLNTAAAFELYGIG